ncbi:MAG: helix-turn-helix transcriptional regulator [Clostridia bacterium]|nr:helix-turn-helix transcriptional regulator [Clostridia bacterium]
MAPQRDEKVAEMRVFAERLRNHRKMKGWSQKKLGEITGLGTALISQYERQLSVPKIDTAERLADALGVSVDYLLGRSNMYLVESPRKVEQIGEAWGEEMIETLYRARHIPEQDRKVITDLIQRWVERTEQLDKSDNGKDDKEK